MKKVLFLIGKGLYLLAGLVFKAVGASSNAALEIRAEIRKEIEEDKQRAESTKKRPWQR